MLEMRFRRKILAENGSLSKPKRQTPYYNYRYRGLPTTDECPLCGQVEKRAHVITTCSATKEYRDEVYKNSKRINYEKLRKTGHPQATNLVSARLWQGTPFENWHLKWGAMGNSPKYFLATLSGRLAVPLKDFDRPILPKREKGPLGLNIDEVERLYKVVEAQSPRSKPLDWLKIHKEFNGSSSSRARNILRSFGTYEETRTFLRHTVRRRTGLRMYYPSTSQTLCCNLPWSPTFPLRKRLPE
jgi:hypothetical protein